MLMKHFFGFCFFVCGGGCLFNLFTILNEIKKYISKVLIVFVSEHKTVHDKFQIF